MKDSARTLCAVYKASQLSWHFVPCSHCLFTVDIDLLVVIDPPLDLETTLLLRIRGAVSYTAVENQGGSQLHCC